MPSHIIITVLVNPGKLTLNFDPSLRPYGDGDDVSDGLAEGVLTVRITGRPPMSHGPQARVAGGRGRWVTLRLGSRKYQWQLPVGQEVWRTTYSFLVHHLEQDVVRGCDLVLVISNDLGFRLEPVEDIGYSMLYSCTSCATV